MEPPDITPEMVLSNSRTLSDAEIGLRYLGHSRAFSWGAWDSFSRRPASLAGIVAASVAEPCEREKRAEIEYSRGWQFGQDYRERNAHVE